ncbi:hypothetical protein AtubIFM55763_011302 [Aspergillus tubingensis]|uniref:Similar to An18g05790 n=1 Tax=Aspergillus niger TaxID=5061 RepID=A0A117E1R4_ASPNG|nr:similar to An18g05790 [Aspergillus niger]GLA59854.1 hypothetical protein AtubIFM54640_011176 [Aspergillus tubingensis]GLA70101.1 hypothetical protein AtubIFM55763_011302 [Aspergillus tubingensis]
MEPWQRNIRRMHQVSEVLDLDPQKSDMIADFVALIQAIREGLTQIDDDSYIPDSQINMLFLTKLKECPDWGDWASAMLRDGRMCSSNPTEQVTFQELAQLAMEQEKIRQQRGRSAWGTSGHGAAKRGFASPLEVPEDPRALTQDEINAFVVKQMHKDEAFRNRSGSVRRHAKRPSQEEINDYVVEQMRREREQATRNRSHSQPMQEGPVQRPVQMRCTFCGDRNHQLSNCWRRWRVAVEAPNGNYLPKRVEYRTEFPGQPPMYRTGFTLF